MRPKMFTDVPHGDLPAGTVTHLGTIIGRSLTAYLVATVDGPHRVERYVAFDRLHGPYRPTAPLVVFG